MSEQTLLQHYEQLAHLQLNHYELLTPAGTDALQLLTDIELKHPNFSEHPDVISLFNSDSPMPVSIGPIQDTEGREPHSRVLQILIDWLSNREQDTELTPDAVIVLCPLKANQFITQLLPWKNVEITFTSHPIELLAQLNNTAKASLESQPNQAGNTQTILVLTIDSRIDLATFSYAQSPLYHELNPEGQIPSEGLTALWFQVQPQASLAVVSTEEPFSQNAVTENTLALKELFEHQPENPENVLTNHDHSQNQITEVYRYTHLQNNTAQKPFEQDKPYPAFTHPVPIETTTESKTFTSIRQSLGNTGLNEIALQLALVACSQQYDAPKVFTGLIFWHEHTRIYWPQLNYTPFAKGNCNE